MTIQFVLDDLAVCSQDIAAFGALTADQFNWQPSATSWSVAQCVEHLRLANNAYQAVIREALEPDRKPTFWERLPVLPTLFGSVLLSSLEPGKSRPIKTKPAFVPASYFDLSLLSSFEQSQQDIIQTIRLASAHDMKAIIVTSVFARFVTYSLFDACHIVAVHERRHIRQAQLVMQQARFPVSGVESGQLPSAVM